MDYITSKTPCVTFVPGTSSSLNYVTIAPGLTEWEPLIALFRSARTSCTTFDRSVPSRPCARKIWITYTQAYMPYES